MGARHFASLATQMDQLSGLTQKIDSLVWFSATRLFSLPRTAYPGCGFRFLSSLYSDPREKPLEQSAIALMAPIQSLARLNQLVQILDKTADWLLTTT